MLLNIFRKCGGKVTTDSRKIEPGSIFFALRGENFNGNLYAKQALEAGAAFAVVDDKNITGDNIIHVENTLTALQSLAHEYRQSLDIPIIALTGSNGKTTTKELCARVLSTKYRCAATVGNLNNHIGVPLTLLSFTPQTEIGIVEMGANHSGEIAMLCKIASPNVGLITNIGIAHLEGFGSPEGVRAAKGELYDYLQANSGEAIYNIADDTLCAMVTQREGLHAVGYDPMGEKLMLNVYGEYNQLNAHAAIAIGTHFSISKQDALRAVRSYTPSNNRSQIIQTENNTLYMDAYNANPSSMKAAIENFASQELIGKVLILGEMRELGEYSATLHRDIVELCDTLKLDNIIFVGKEFANYHAEHLFFDSSMDLREYLLSTPFVGKHILIKGSRAVALEKIIDLL